MAAETKPEIPMRNEKGALLLRFHKISLATATLALAAASQSAFAQSTGTDAIEESMSEVVVSATRVRNIGIVGDQTAPKSRVTLTGEYISQQTAGNTLFSALNQIPGVNFTNSDPYGTSGGNLRIRGFDGSRVSVTFDGIPLNDSGNYALFTNQMLDPELVDRVDVNLGTTDVDSPTASATGGTVAYRTRKPADEFGGQAVVSAGENNYKRAFLRVDTGEWGSLGTKALFSASYQKYDKFKGPGELEKKQVNAVFRQDFENDNFISLAFHYNRNRNAFYRTTSDANFDAFGRDYDNLAVCTRDAPTADAVDNDNLSSVPSTPALLNTDNPLNTSSCTNYYGLRINPSDTGNVRMQSLWHLGDKVRLTFDPSWQYTLANGGGTTTINERPGTTADIRQIGTADVIGWDLNGDGDTIDTAVRFYSPNTTNTKRWVATTSLIWDINEDNRLRFAYTWDRARHRQTGMWGLLDDNGDPENVFAGRQGQRVYAADGDIIRGRDRFSIAELKQYALEWRGQFAEDKLIATVGLRAPYFTRELNQYCYTPNGGSGNSANSISATNGSTLCTSRAPTATLPNGNVIFQANPMGAVEFIAPYSEEVKFDDLLPNVGLSFSPWNNNMFYLSYAEGLSAPRTDNLYSVRRQPDNSVGRPTPESETTKAYDLGWRYSSGSTMASIAVWKIDYTNRIVSSFDPELGFSVDRNVGDVDLDGLEMQVGQRLGSAVALSASAAYAKSELLEDLPFGLNPLGEQQFLPLKGNELVESPDWTFTLRADFDVTDNLRFGMQGKKVGDRFSTDLNDEKVSSYTVFDLDLDYTFKIPGFDSVQMQFNVTNLTDEEYYGNISSGAGRNSTTPLPCLNGVTGVTANCVNSAGVAQNGGVGFFSIGAPRTASVSIKLNF
jgi:iron complex outermembrane recepter protein